MQVRIFNHRYSSSRSPYVRRWMTRILLFRIWRKRLEKNGGEAGMREGCF